MLKEFQKKYKKFMKKRYGSVVPMIVGGDKTIWNFNHPLLGPQHFRRVTFQWRHEKAWLCFKPTLEGYQCSKTGLIIEAKHSAELIGKFHELVTEAVVKNELPKFTKKRAVFERRFNRL